LRSLSGGAPNINAILRVSTPYFSAIVSGAIPLPFDFDIFSNDVSI
jgi:hypothetical protein